MMSRPPKHMVDLPVALLGLSRNQNSPVGPQNAKHLNIAKTFNLLYFGNVFYLTYAMFYHSLTNGFSLVGGHTFYNSVVIFRWDTHLNNQLFPSVCQGVSPELKIPFVLCIYLILDAIID